MKGRGAPDEAMSLFVMKTGFERKKSVVGTNLDDTITVFGPIGGGRKSISDLQFRLR